MIILPAYIQPGKHSDVRGTLLFYNEFDLTAFRRMYSIRMEKGITRAWQGHLKEQKVFWPVAGKVEVQLVPFQEHQRPQIDKRMSYTLDSENPGLLIIPGGYLNGFEALTDQASLLVFSDMSVQESLNDDYRFSIEQIEWKRV